MPATPSSDAAPATILTVSAFLLGALGAALLFAPVELSAAFGWAAGPEASGLAGTGLLAVAMLNWMGRGAVYGGIYGRPIMVANLTLGFAGALTLFNAQTDGAARPLGWLPLGILALNGVAFFWLLRRRF